MTRQAVVILALGLSVALTGGGTGGALADWTYQPATDRWVRGEAKDVNTEISDNQFQHALECHQAGRSDQAERVLDGWLRFYRGHRDCQAALFLLGEVRRCMGRYDGAFTAYEELLDRYAGSELFDHVLGLETEMAQAYLNGRKRKLLDTIPVSAEDEGETMLEKIFQRDLRGSRGKQALALLADFRFRQGRFAEAEEDYQKLALHFPHDRDAGAFKLLAAQAALARFRGVRHDGRPLIEARQRLEQLQQEHPDQAARAQVGQLLGGIDERKAEKDFEVGEFYKRTGQTKAAIFYYRAVARDYPATVWAARALDRLAALGVDDRDSAKAPPRVLAAGVAPQPGAVGGRGLAAGGPADGPPLRPRILWAGPAPIDPQTGPDGQGVIDIGPPVVEDTSRWPAGQLADVADSATSAGPSTQAEDADDP